MIEWLKDRLGINELRRYTNSQYNDLHKMIGGVSDQIHDLRVAYLDISNSQREIRHWLSGYKKEKPNELKRKKR